MLGSVNFNARAGSPLEKVATTWPLSTGSPQSSASRTTIDDGHPAGAAKALVSPVCVKASRAGVHPATALVFDDAGIAVAGCTTSVALVVRIDVPESEKVMSPL